jgi:hypothetical protein
VPRFKPHLPFRNDKGCAVGPCYTLTLASRSPDAIGCRYKVLHALSAAMFRAVHRTKSYMKFGFDSFVSDSAD